MMSILKSLSPKEEKAFKELQMRMKNAVTPKMHEDDILYYRFLKARDFDVDKAEKMLKKHIVWRKVNQIDTIVEDFKPSPVFLLYAEPSLLGYDKAGDMVFYSPAGKFNPVDLMKPFTFSNFMKHWYWCAENYLAMGKEENARTGRDAYQAVIILDLDQLTFAAVSSRIAVEMFLRFLNAYQDNYPERMKAAYVINAPSYYVIIFSILRSVMSGDMLNKIHIFGRDGWKEKLIDIMDPDILPAFLGGNRTDPDGNPKCKNIIVQDASIPYDYYKSKEERYLKDKTSSIKKLVIPPNEKREIRVDLRNFGSLLQWEFLVKGKDIGFGIFLETSEHMRREIIPIHRYDTADGAEKDSLKCRIVGKYIVVFDNTYSWMSTKEVSYCLTVVNSAF